MTGTTTGQLPLTTATDSDDTENFLTVSLTAVLQVLTNLFDSVTGHDHSGAGKGAPVVLGATSVGTAAIANGAVTNAKLASDVARANQLVNGGFEIWQRGNGPFTANNSYSADRWYQGLSGTDTLSVIPTSANVDGASRFALQATFVKGSGTNTAIQQYVEDFYQLKGRTVSISIRVWCDTASGVRLWCYQGAAGARVYGTVHTGGSTWQTLTLTTAVDAAASAQPQFGIEFNASCIARLDNAMLVVGSVAADYAPLTPADELARCLRYYETTATGTGGGNPSLTAYGSAGMLWRSPIAFAAKKCVTPTMTIGAAAAWLATNCSAAPIIAGQSVDAATIGTTVTALGVFTFTPATGAATVVAEANP